MMQRLLRAGLHALGAPFTELRPAGAFCETASPGVQSVRQLFKSKSRYTAVCNACTQASMCGHVW